MGLQEQVTAVEDFLNNIRLNAPPKIDGRELSTALELIFSCGVQMNEIQDIKIDSLIYNKNNILTAIQIQGNPPINVTDRARTILSIYVNYLQSNPKFFADSNPPLFPKYRNVKAIQRDIDKFSENIRVQEIHKVGVKKHFKDLLDQGVNEKESLQDTAQHFRMTERSVKQLIDNKIQKAGIPKESDYDIELKAIHELMDYILIASSEDKVINNKQMVLEKIYIAKQLSVDKKFFYSKLIYKESNDRLVKIFKSDIEIANEEIKKEELAKKELVDKTLSARERWVKLLEEVFF